ncbi:MAG: hypothetical protein RSB70_05715 [Clostridium sp.]
MKLCSNCSSNMINQGQLKLNNAPLANVVIKIDGELEKINTFVCPNCGNVQLYVCSNSK